MRLTVFLESDRDRARVTVVLGFALLRDLVRELDLGRESELPGDADDEEELEEKVPACLDFCACTHIYGYYKEHVTIRLIYTVHMHVSLACGSTYDSR